MKPHPPGAVASLIFGILAMIGWIMPMVGVVMGILAIINARRATTSLMATPESYVPGGLHTAGLVTGIIGLVLSTLVLLWMLLVFGLIGAIASAFAGQPMVTPMNQAQPLLW